MVLYFIIDLAVRRRSLILFCLLLAVGAGIVLLPRIKLETFPAVTPAQVVITTESPGLAAVEVERLVTVPIEAVMQAVPSVADVQSVSRSGFSRVTVVFAENTTMAAALQQVQQRLQIAGTLLPDSAGSPRFRPRPAGGGAVFRYLLEAKPGSGYDAMALRSLNDDWVVPSLLSVKGVAEVYAAGGQVRQYQIHLSPEKLLAYQLDIDAVLAAIKANNLAVDGGYIVQGDAQWRLRGEGRIPPGEAGLAAIRRITVKYHRGAAVRIADLGEVGFGAESPRQAMTLSRQLEDGRVQQFGEVMTGMVLMADGARDKSTSDAIFARLSEIEQQLPPGLRLKPFVQDSIDQALLGFSKALAWGCFFIALMMAFLLPDLRAILLVVLSVLFALGGAGLSLALFDLPVNLMSLGGLFVAFGLVVAAIVMVVDNMFSQLSRREAQDPLSGDPVRRRQTLSSVAREVARPVFWAIVSMSAAVALVFGFDGVAGKLFRPMAISLLLALLASALVAILVVPALVGYGLRPKQVPAVQRWFEPLAVLYQQALYRCLEHPRRVAVVAGAFLLMGLVGGLFLGSEWVPKVEDGRLTIQVELPAATRMETALALAPTLEAELLTFPEVTYALSRIGGTGLGAEAGPPSRIEIVVGLKPSRWWVSAPDRAGLEHRIAHRLNRHPGLGLTFSQPLAMRLDEQLTGAESPLSVKLFGPDLDELERSGQMLKQLLQNVPGVRDIAMAPLRGEFQVVVRAREDAMARHGFAKKAVMEQVAAGIGGIRAGTVIGEQGRQPIFLHYNSLVRENAAAIKDLPLLAPGGEWLRLAEVAEVRFELTPSQISREQLQRRVAITANVEDRDLGGVVADLRGRLAQMDLPPAYRVVIDGQYSIWQEAMPRLLQILLIALVMLVGLLYYALGSVRQALLVIGVVPLALVGGIAALLLNGSFLSVPALVGFIILSGLSLFYGFILLDAMNRCVAAGVDYRQAIVQGMRSRLKSILMIALSVVLGLLPLLSSQGLGLDIQQPVGLVIIGGVVSTVLLIPFIWPVFYAACFSGRRLGRDDLVEPGSAA